MTPFKEVALHRLNSTCQPEIMCIHPDQLLGQPQVDHKNIESFPMPFIYPIFLEGCCRVRPPVAGYL